MLKFIIDLSNCWILTNLLVYFVIEFSYLYELYQSVTNYHFFFLVQLLRYDWWRTIFWILESWWWRKWIWWRYIWFWWYIVFIFFFFCWGGGSVILSVYYLTHSAPKLPDATEVVKSLAKSKLPSKSGLNEKIELLQRAEERYYQNNFSNRKVNLKRSVP